MTMCLSILFIGECDWDKVNKVCNKFNGCHCFSYSRAVYYNGDSTTCEAIIFELSKLGYPMHIMRNI